MYFSQIIISEGGEHFGGEKYRILQQQIALLDEKMISKKQPQKNDRQQQQQESRCISINLLNPSKSTIALLLCNLLPYQYQYLLVICQVSLCCRSSGHVQQITGKKCTFSYSESVDIDIVSKTDLSSPLLSYVCVV